jgi:hypothetical protein
LTRRADAATPTTLLKERVAQLVEHLTFNQEVMGSNPIALTIEINALRQESASQNDNVKYQGSHWGNEAPRRAALIPAARSARLIPWHSRGIFRVLKR